jgi:protein SCO1/2
MTAEGVVMTINGKTLAGSILALLCLFGLGACARSYAFHGKLIETPQQAPDFMLTDQHGQPFRLSDQHGKVVLLLFGYTSCPDVCPTTLSDLASVQHELGQDAQQVEVAFISVDPARDTQAVLQRYMNAFDPAFIGLRGSSAELNPILAAYHVRTVRTELSDSPLGYAMDHSAFIYVIDPSGRWCERFLPSNKVADIVVDVRYLVQNGRA